MYVCSSREDLISQLRAAEKPAIPAAASRNDKTGGVAMVFTGEPLESFPDLCDGGRPDTRPDAC